eukprot:gene9267-58194_t
MPELSRGLKPQPSVLCIVIFATLLSTAASFLGGWFMYQESLKSLELQTRDFSFSTLQIVSADLNKSYTEPPRAVVNLYHSWYDNPRLPDDPVVWDD